MVKVTQKWWIVGPVVALGLYAGGPVWCFAQSNFTGTNARWNNTKKDPPSLTQRFTSSLKNGFNSVSEAATPKSSVQKAEDPISLSTKSQPSAELFTAVGRMYEGTNRLDDAEKQYRAALKKDPRYLGALLGYARLKDRQGHRQAAAQLYQQAAKAHPEDASVFNNMGLFYAKHGRLPEGIAALRQATSLDPKNAKYRNNLATVLVETNRYDEALQELQAVHNEAIAHYNLAYLLERKGQPQAAAQHFTRALHSNPALDPARQGLDRVRQHLMQARLPQPTTPSMGDTLRRDPSVGREGSRFSQPSSQPYAVPQPPPMRSEVPVRSNVVVPYQRPASSQPYRTPAGAIQRSGIMPPEASLHGTSAPTNQPALSPSGRSFSPPPSSNLGTPASGQATPQAPHPMAPRRLPPVSRSRRLRESTPDAPLPNDLKLDPRKPETSIAKAATLDAPMPPATSSVLPTAYDEQQ